VRCDRGACCRRCCLCWGGFSRRKYDGEGVKGKERKKESLPVGLGVLVDFGVVAGED
jgi:hypothetical protein